MIATVRKVKLPAFLAYPMGAKAISEALSDVPQVENLELWFVQNDKGEPEAVGNHLVVTARYKRHNMGLSASHSMEESGLYRPNWEIWGYAVPKEMNSCVRSALLDNGFDLIRDWFAKPRTELWLTTSHRFALWYSPNENRLTSVQSDT